MTDSDSRKLDEIKDQLNGIAETQKEILERMEDAEAVTDPIRKVSGSVWDKTVYALGWGLLILIGIGGYFLLRVLKKIPKWVS